MKVVAYDPFVDPAAVRETGAEPVDLDELLGVSDFVSLHARATAENRGLIGSPQIARMKRGAYLVNTARDTLVDEAAVMEGLATGLHPLLSHPNVIITTHIGGATYETLHHAGEMAVAAIRRLTAGEPLLDLADPSVVIGRRAGSAV
jgi:D-3-phosphoglycerate dehydrogenase / 2-oxoglutarate reductase